MSVAQRLTGKRICICVGSGGVGKTTTAAAVAIGLAARGGRVAVVTIDPARRLADALGLAELDNEPRRIDRRRFASRGIELRGELWAMMLDAKRTFDELVEHLAPDAAVRDEILANGIYQQLSTAIAGSHEFSAIAKLYELDRSGRFDAIVLDTPPSRNALDFLDAPGRLTAFLEGRALHVLLAPSGVAGTIAARGSAVAFAGLHRLTGLDLLQDISSFLAAFSGISAGFRDRAEAVHDLLGDPATTFLLVTSTGRASVKEAVFFKQRLEAGGLPLGAAIVNRVHPLAHRPPPVDLDALSAALHGDERLATRAVQALRDLRMLAERDASAVERLRHELGIDDPLLVPNLPGDVHDIDGLVAVHRFLFASAPTLRVMLADAAF